MELASGFLDQMLQAMGMEVRAYEAVAASLTVTHIRDSLDELDIYTEIRVAREVMGGEYALVRDEGRTLGYVTSHDVESYREPSDMVISLEYRTIGPDTLLSSSTPILDVPELLAQHSLLFVLDRSSIAGALTRTCMDKLPAKICLLCLLFELEGVMRQMLAESPECERHLKALSPKRRQAAEDLWAKKYGAKEERNAARILSCTYFCDKGDMVRKDKHLRQLMPFQTERQSKQYFRRADQMRNEIAHSGGSIWSVVADPAELHEFIAQTRELEKGLLSGTVSPELLDLVFDR